MTPGSYKLPRDHEEIFTTPWVAMHSAHVTTPDGTEDYIYSHETRCDGHVVAVLPYRHTDKNRRYEILLHESANPAWHGRYSRWLSYSSQVLLDSITGGWENGEDLRDTAARELLEEGGYDRAPAHFTALGTCFAGKSADTVNHLFAVDLTGVEPARTTPSGDGSVIEKMEKPRWMLTESAALSLDPLVAVMIMRLQLVRRVKLLSDLEA
jgi:8-oxo-dGTP pyrophosphatase MutT (NUDIX family)